MFPFMRGGRVAQIAPQDAMDGQAKGEVIIVDIRDGAELKMSGKAKGAKHIPMMLLQSKGDPRHPEFDTDLKGKTLALYCASGARSQAAAQMLTGLGHQDVRNLGGLMGWVRAGGAVEPV